MFDHDLLTYLEGYLTEERKRRFLQVLAMRTKFLTVAIEDVFQLHNTSAVLRSCDAFGIQELHVIQERFGERLDKNIAVGAEKWVDVHQYATTLDCMHALRSKGYQIIATTPHDDSVLLPDFQITAKTAVFFGTEWEGLSEELMQHADGFLKIPMVGFSESLNISVSVAIILQELTQRLRHSDLDWKLNQREVLDKRLDWTKKTIKNVEGIIGRYRSD